MARRSFDKGSKYLVQKHTRGILVLGGATKVRSCRAIQAELVQSGQLPDGLIEVYFEGQKKPDHVLVEVATYPEKRALQQALDDLTIARKYLRGVLPELLMLVLCRKGKFEIPGEHEVQSRLGWSSLKCTWKVVELWKIPAEKLLNSSDAGVIPLVPLTRYDGPPAELLEQCREQIENKAAAAEKENLLAVTQVMAGLKFPDPQLLALLGGKQVMFESPVIVDLVAEKLQEAILDVLKDRYAKVPKDVRQLLAEIKSEKKLLKLNVLAGRSESIEAFKEHLLA